ncbi:nucleoside 2-deoxyribosyltransferase domain-containing protein [Umezawaea sp. Da 62-37]|uniref:nucleoside 2-deoxyribosyltransferase domain-containing protein n=1 Tax=Umezawaea sp. Da 62-37 TaxID=3075927 RepID=UPI0028F70C20|nr:nucleoside 2-deoxyribosyltransferase domain-containing protein [Umezawaea sp. Da 62-37]WNV84914.1 nucleoside 2-deoxyribosyltransferase domain-containing protein [Umezawaea sp. Da 62-37]
MSVELVFAREPAQADRPSVMLLGPTPVAETVPSWRPQVIELLAAGWRGVEPLVVLSPESRGEVRARRYEDQVASELKMIEAADAAMFWISRDVTLLPGFTTNVEFGLIAGTSPERGAGLPSGLPQPRAQPSPN